MIYFPGDKAEVVQQFIFYCCFMTVIIIIVLLIIKPGQRRNTLCWLFGKLIA